MFVLMRFQNRRGHVKELRSDNATNIVGADNEIRESIQKMNHGKVERHLIEKRVK